MREKGEKGIKGARASLLATLPSLLSPPPSLLKDVFVLTISPVSTNYSQS